MNKRQLLFRGYFLVTVCFALGLANFALNGKVLFLPNAPEKKKCTH